ncbi:hypothetical protein ACE14D_13920 [Streptomyces sp. Act-28]
MLSWVGAEGRTCILITDSEGGPVSRYADSIESIRLDHAAHALARARRLAPSASADDLRGLVECLAGHLGEALRVADSRGRRLRA